MDCPGFEIYAGDWVRIREACRNDRFEALRAGEFSNAHILFPSAFGPADLLLLEGIVAKMASPPIADLEIERDEVQGCLFVDRIAPEWVNSVAALAVQDGPQLFHQWVQRFVDAENCLPEWSGSEFERHCGQLISTCHTARETHVDLVMVWFL